MIKTVSIILILFFIISFFFSSQITYSYPLTQTQRSNSYYPSYLLLSNWKNLDIWIVTGIPIPDALLNGFPNYSTSIRNIYYQGYLLNSSILFNFNTTASFLTLNNSVLLSNNQGKIRILTPEYQNYILITSFSSVALKITLQQNNISEINNTYFYFKEPFGKVYVLTNFTTLLQNNSLQLIGKGYRFIEISFITSVTNSISSIIQNSSLTVKQWLNKSKFPKNLPSNLIKEYDLSLLVLKDDQNPWTGEFVASPSPIYLYNWMRDSSFAAIALQDAGHYNSALKYWLWMASAQRLKPGVWYTRYNFYTGTPDKSFGIDELDSLGIFEVGIYNYFQLTHNYSFLREILPSLNQTVNYQINSIKNSTFHLLPEDLSVWEDREAYHFWTEAFNDLGLKDVAIIYSKLNLSNMSILNAQKMLNQSIMKNFVYDSYFASTLETTVEFTSNGSKTILVPYSPFIDSAVILPIDFGLIPLNSNISQSTMGKIQHTLTINGGLARFLGDTYHYDNTLYDSSEPNPPWIITTLFEALYYAKTNNYTEAVNLLTWAYNHSQNGLLPEAVDPKYGNPLPTTSPLTWSSAMFVIVSLNLHNVTHLHTTTSTSTIAKPNGYLDTVIVVVIVIIIILLVIIIKKK